MGNLALYLESKHAQVLYEEMIEEAVVILLTEAHLEETCTKNAEIHRIRLRGQKYEVAVNDLYTFAKTEIGETRIKNDRVHFCLKAVTSWECKLLLKLWRF